jgi:RES domain-containing protein
MSVWRICKQRTGDKLAGLGGLYVSGRWHHIGHRILYTSATASLAALEVLVHLDPDQAPDDLILLEIEVPDGVKIEICNPLQITTKHWQTYPPPHELQDFGTRWLEEQRTAILSVPSAIVSIEFNYLINPEHPEAKGIKLLSERPFVYDQRLTS